MTIRATIEIKARYHRVGVAGDYEWIYVAMFREPEHNPGVLIMTNLLRSDNVSIYMRFHEMKPSFCWLGDTCQSHLAREINNISYSYAKSFPPNKQGWFHKNHRKVAILVR